MRKIFLAIALCTAVGLAFAQNVHIGSGTVALGDSVAQLLKVAGKPDSIRPFPGLAGFELYEYSSNGRTITFTVHSGKVTGMATMEPRAK